MYPWWKPRLDFKNYRFLFPKRESGKTHVDEEDKQIIQKGQFTTLEIPNRGLPNLGNPKTQGYFNPEFGQRGTWLINESRLYSLMLINKFSLAKEFKSWLYIKNIAINYYLSVLIAPLFPLLCLDSIRAKIMVEIV